MLLVLLFSPIGRARDLPTSRERGAGAGIGQDSRSVPSPGAASVSGDPDLESEQR
ncbi:hypothetical protein M877_29265 [Streptomyces niveus NCIMB 11891]|nr:hypothetical protein M877_29265 [Streptomyces niveus NCIMB 11891]